MSREVLDVFMGFEVDEQCLIKGLIETAYINAKKPGVDMNKRVFLLLQRLRAILSKIKPRYLSYEFILREKRFLFLVLEGLSLIWCVNQDDTIKEMLLKEIRYIKSDFERFEEYNITLLIDNSKEGQDVLKEHENLLKDAKKYNLASFKELLSLCSKPRN